jgi:hypothetical protein
MLLGVFRVRLGIGIYLITRCAFGYAPGNFPVFSRGDDCFLRQYLLIFKRFVKPGLCAISGYANSLSLTCKRIANAILLNCSFDAWASQGAGVNKSSAWLLRSPTILSNKPIELWRRACGANRTDLRIGVLQVDVFGRFNIGGRYLPRA